MTPSTRRLWLIYPEALTPRNTQPVTCSPSLGCRNTSSPSWTAVGGPAHPSRLDQVSNWLPDHGQQVGCWQDRGPSSRQEENSLPKYASPAQGCLKIARYLHLRCCLVWAFFLYDWITPLTNSNTPFYLLHHGRDPITPWSDSWLLPHRVSDNLVMLHAQVNEWSSPVPAYKWIHGSDL
jgi:hypothetical protein